MTAPQLGFVLVTSSVVMRGVVTALSAGPFPDVTGHPWLIRWTRPSLFGILSKIEQEVPTGDSAMTERYAKLNKENQWAPRSDEHVNDAVA